METYQTPHLEELEHMKNVLINYWGEKIKYQNKNYILLYIGKTCIMKADKTHVYSGYCELKDDEGNIIKVSIKEVYDIVLKMS